MNTVIILAALLLWPLITLARMPGARRRRVIRDQAELRARIEAGIRART